jgi:hypothetical protein
MKIQLLAAVLAVASAQPCFAQQITIWQLATGFRTDSFQTQNIAQLAGEVEMSTEGALRIELRANNTLFQRGEIRQAVQDGKAPSHCPRRGVRLDVERDGSNEVHAGVAAPRDDGGAECLLPLKTSSSAWAKSYSVSGSSRWAARPA